MAVIRDVAVQLGFRAKSLHLVTAKANLSAVHVLADVPLHAVIRMKPAAELGTAKSLKGLRLAEYRSELLRVVSIQIEGFCIEREFLERNRLFRFEFSAKELFFGALVWQPLVENHLVWLLNAGGKQPVIVEVCIRLLAVFGLCECR